MSSQQEFKGLFGLWNWPLLNAFLQRMRPASNTERWRWTDYKGQERTLEVDRTVH